MPGLSAAIGGHPYLYLVAEKIASREFGPADAMALIRYSDLMRHITGAHPGPHVSVTSPVRARDFHLENKYANRVFHTMFGSEEHAAEAIARAINTQCGAEAITRLKMLTLGPRAVLYSRSGATAQRGVVRSAGAGGVSWTEGRTSFITVVLEHSGDGQLMLITAYPNLEPLSADRLAPPDGADLLEMPRRVFSVYWLRRASTAGV